MLEVFRHQERCSLFEYRVLSFKTSDSNVQFLDFLLLRVQRLALQGDACAFQLKLSNPTAQSRFAYSERACSFDETVSLLE
ncbi:hypothetical protein BOH74_18625 [Pseudomonas versuta]|uniref:Uncharacterized protein n=1 Tax=Pseudomonas versuta TaxID=1788301 RepID=A0A0M4QJ44_9PSED|nr:hypothetical protein AOC04_11985 [Pseudomonas versuta]OKA19203.1 hypothetical protein BOH74_18625 [Pseudomonas versuta]OKA21673.1 hypothetical protein BOH73_10285 [Pseudomonas versuta]